MVVPAQIHDRRRRSDRRRSTPHPVTHDLGEALTDGAVALLFQPQIVCADGALHGGEALIRWQHPEHGEMAGDTIVGVAEHGGLGRRLARYAARAAIGAASRWPVAHRLSINVSAMDLADRTYTADLIAMLEEAAFAPERLTLEITEQALVDDIDSSVASLNAFADIGIRIALDDFGAGFCNFRYLKMLPLHALKLDRSMIEGVATDQRDLAVLRGIVAMARALDLTVIAEGVETEAQRDMVAAEGCDIWQGYYGSRPVPAESFAALAARLPA